MYCSPLVRLVADTTHSQPCMRYSASRCRPDAKPEPRAITFRQLTPLFHVITSSSRKKRFTITAIPSRESSTPFAKPTPRKAARCIPSPPLLTTNPVAAPAAAHLRHHQARHGLPPRRARAPPTFSEQRRDEDVKWGFSRCRVSETKQQFYSRAPKASILSASRAAAGLGGKGV